MPSMVREESYNSVKVFWLETDRIIERLRELAEEIVRNGMAEKVILFGSLANRRAVPGSDADILIIVKEESVPGEERVADFNLFFRDIGIGVDVFPYTVSELDLPLARNAVKQGIVLASRG
jgi:predicted nucleotidyltransferase